MNNLDTSSARTSSFALAFGRSPHRRAFLSALTCGVLGCFVAAWGLIESFLLGLAVKFLYPWVSR